ncbi:MAG: class I tRNA ligase family protein, partial [Solirubrobacterales bacterium]
MEERIAARWKEGRVFERSMEQRADEEVWSFYEGPPTANGRPGSHHVLSRVFKDIYPRYRSMQGYRVPRKAGWDCHGLPVELEVEKQLGISSKQEIEEYGIEGFNQKCRESVFTYVEEWNRLTERIGFWIDLDDPYVTLDNNYIESVWWSLKELWKSNRLYEGHRVSPYCPRCGTTLSSHEVAQGYKDVIDPSVWVRFKLKDSEASMLVWTTTPWTLPGNYAVAVNPDVTYAKVHLDGETLILAEPLVEKVLGEGTAISEKVTAADLLGLEYEAPFPGMSETSGAFKVISGDFVTTDDGTGLVHIAPAFGEDDYRVAIDQGLYDPVDGEHPLFNPVSLDGHFDERVAGFGGEFVKDPDVTQRLIDHLEQSGRLFKATEYEHSYPHCWRCSTPLLYYAKASWYIRTSEARDKMLAGNEDIGWHPEHIKDGRFGKWLENNVDWALSRDRYWGTPHPIWECSDKNCDETFCAGSIQELKD